MLAANHSLVIGNQGSGELPGTDRVTGFSGSPKEIFQGSNRALIVGPKTR
jgi:hypothetical protein